MKISSHLFLLLMSWLTFACEGNLIVVGGNKASANLIERLLPVVALPGATVLVYGTGFSKNTKASIAGLAVNLVVKNSNLAVLTLPQGTPDGILPISFKFSDTQSELAYIMQGDSHTIVPITNLGPEKICQDFFYLNVKGLIAHGSQNCNNTLFANQEPCSSDGETGCLTQSDFPAVDKNLELLAHQALIHHSLTPAQVEGKMRDCGDGDSSCFIPRDAGMKAIATAGLAAGLIKKGVVLGGVTGSLEERRPDCTTEADENCIAVAAFPSADRGGIVASGLDSSLQIIGISGTMGPCVANGSDCYLAPYLALTQNLKAIDVTLITPDALENSYTLAGVAGILTSTPPPCGSNGQIACIADTNYPSAIKSNLIAAKILTGFTLASVSGTQGHCNADGGLGCYASTNFPAAQKSLLLGGKFRSGLTLGGVAGSLANCAVNASGCFVPAYAASTQPLKAIGFDVIQSNVLKTGTSVAGISGNVIPKPADCLTDGATACVTVADYRTVSLSALNAQKANIHSSVTIGPVTGTLANCSSILSSACFTLAAYPSTDKSAITSAAALVHNSLSLSGVGGTLPSCATDGATGCLSVSTFPSIDKSDVDANKSKIVSGFNLAGVGGTLADCSTGGSDCRLPSYIFGSQSLKAINFDGVSAANIKIGATLAGIAGTLVMKPDSCSQDGQSNCVALSNFPAIDKSVIDAGKSKIRTGLTLGGIAGTLQTCADDGDTSCFTVTAFPSIDPSYVTTHKAQIHSSLVIGGVTGTLATCASLDSDCMLGAYATISQPLKAIDFDGIVPSIIKSGSVIAGISGSVVPTAADCQVNGSTSCVTVSAFPAVDRSAVESAKSGIHDSLTLGSVGGTLPSCASDDGTNCLTNSTYPAYDKAFVGTHLGSMTNAVTIAGSTGTMADCAAGSSNCFIPTYVTNTQPLKAISFDSLTPGVLKAGTIIAGVTGNYPSSTYPMPTGDPYDELDATLFNSQMTSASTYGWFDRNGDRYAHAGSADLVANNIISGTDIFGISGNIGTGLAEWDVRVGKSFGINKFGKLKANCRNAGHSTWNMGLLKKATADATTDRIAVNGIDFANGDSIRVYYGTTAGGGGFLNTDNYYVINHDSAGGNETFQVSTTVGGSTVFDITSNQTALVVAKLNATAGINSTVEYNSGFVGSYTNPWSSADVLCSGVETVAGDDNVWKDVTTGGCISGACRYWDKISNLEWTSAIGNYTWDSGVSVCKTLNFDGFSGVWRMPTAYEGLQAASHGITLINDPNFSAGSTFVATTQSDSIYNAYSAAFSGSGYMNSGSKSTPGSVMCVKDH